MKTGNIFQQKFLVPSYKLGNRHLPFSADCPSPLSVVAGSRSCEILVLERRLTERLPFFKVEPAGSAALAPLLKIICFGARCLRRGLGLPAMLAGSCVTPPGQVPLTACVWGCPGGCGAEESSVAARRHCHPQRGLPSRVPALAWLFLG